MVYNRIMRERSHREGFETRHISLTVGIQDRQEGEESNGVGTLTGYAAVFDEETDLGWFREKIARGAFNKSLKEDDQRALMNHDTTLLLGLRSNQTLRLKEDNKGLRVEIDLPDTSYSRDLYSVVKRGDLNGMSIGFRVKKEERVARDEKNNEVKDLWIVKEAELMEVSAVTFPAYEGTSVSARCKERRSEEIKPAPSENSDARLKSLRRKLRFAEMEQSLQRG